MQEQQEVIEWHSIAPEEEYNTVKICGEKIQTVKRPDDPEIVGEVRPKGRYPKRAKVIGRLDDIVDVVEPDTFGKFLYRRRHDLIQVGDNQFLTVVRHRVPLIIVIVIAIIAATDILIMGATGVDPAKTALDYFGSNPAPLESKDNAAIEYTSFESTPDVKWSLADQTHKIRINNDKANPVDMCPHVFIDLNHDGSFTDDECVFNPVKYNDDGSVASFGSRIAPGKSINEITFTRDVQPGDYDAVVRYDAFMSGSEEQGNGMEMWFKASISE